MVHWGLVKDKQLQLLKGDGVTAIMCLLRFDRLRNLL